jgi:hypothetical protein
MSLDMTVTGIPIAFLLTDCGGGGCEDSPRDA